MNALESQQPKKDFGLDGSTLKLIMMILMVLDHIKYFIPSNLSLIFHVLTRCVSVFFAYMAVEGFLYTRNRYKYLGRLLMWSAIMFAGNYILNNLIIKNIDYRVSNNIFLTLFVGVLILYLISKINKRNKLFFNVILILGIIIISAAGSILTEGGMTVLPFMIITYVFREKRKFRNILYLALSALLFILVFTIYETLNETLTMLAYNSDFMFILVLPFLYLYNGKRGNNSTIMKYLFYVFYPLHLWTITIIAWLTRS